MSVNVEFPVWTVGRRKTAVVRLKVEPKSGGGKAAPGVVVINGKSADEYFRGLPRQKAEALGPLSATPILNTYELKAYAKGGGITGQSGAIRLALARAMIIFDPALKPALRKLGMLTRDPRAVERKKPGQPKARKRFQYSKR